MRILIIVLASLLVIYAAYRTYRFVMLDKGLDKRVENGAIILDVRTEREYETGHIKDAVNISLGTLRERYKELDPAKTYITTCSHGLRSVKAESLLKKRGFKKVYNGGAWADLNELVEKYRVKQ